MCNSQKWNNLCRSMSTIKYGHKLQMNTGTTSPSSPSVRPYVSLSAHNKWIVLFWLLFIVSFYQKPINGILMERASRTSFNDKKKPIICPWMDRCGGDIPSEKWKIDRSTEFRINFMRMQLSRRGKTCPAVVSIRTPRNGFARILLFRKTEKN